MATLVLTALGDDQTGLVDALAGVIAEHGGSWTESHMAQLAGKFAGIVVATVPDARVEGLIAALDPLEDRGLLDITVKVADGPVDRSAHRELRLELLGQDRLGIIHDLSHALAELGVGIDDLATETREAPMSAELLFAAQAVLSVPPAVAAGDIEDALAGLADEFMIELRTDE